MDVGLTVFCLTDSSRLQLLISRLNQLLVD